MISFFDHYGQRVYEPEFIFWLGRMAMKEEDAAQLMLFIGGTIALGDAHAGAITAVAMSLPLTQRMDAYRTRWQVMCAPAFGHDVMGHA